MQRNSGARTRSHRQHRQRGSGTVKGVVYLAAIVYAIFCTIKLGTAWADDRSLEHRVNEVLTYADTPDLHYDADDIRYQIERKISELDIRVDLEEHLIVEDARDEWRAELFYKRVIDLVVYTYERDVMIRAAAARF